MELGLSRDNRYSYCRLRRKDMKIFLVVWLWEGVYFLQKMRIYPKTTRILFLQNPTTNRLHLTT